MNIKMYAVNADYRPGKSKNWYYILANNKVEARRKFSERISWLTIKQVVLVEDEAFAQQVLTQPYQYILLR